MGLSNGTELTATSSSLILQATYHGLAYVSTNPAAQSYFAAVAAAGGTISPARQVLYNQLFSSLQSAGLLSKLDRLGMLAAENATTASVDLITKTANLILTGAPTFTANQGYTGGVGKSINTQAVPGSLTNLQQNNNSYGAATLSTRSTGADTVLTGTTNNAGDFALYPMTTVTPNIVADNTGASTFSHAFLNPNANIKGIYQVCRTTSTSRQTYLNGIQVQNIANDTSAAMLAFSFIVGAYRNTDNATIFANSTDVVSAWWCGASFSATDAQNFATILNTYMTAIGSAVF
jgi:hypothetical protein